MGAGGQNQLNPWGQAQAGTNQNDPNMQQFLGGQFSGQLPDGTGKPTGWQPGTMGTPGRQSGGPTAAAAALALGSPSFRPASMDPATAWRAAGPAVGVTRPPQQVGAYGQQPSPAYGQQGMGAGGINQEYLAQILRQLGYAR